MKKTIYFNGKVITVNEENSVMQAILVQEGRIAKVGTNDEVLALKDETTELVDLEGKAVVPGFVDPHGHIVAISQTLLLVQLQEVNSKEEYKETLRKSLAESPKKDGEWLIGFGYDNSKFEDNLHPTKFDLDEISSEVPIMTTHASGHIAVVNSRGLELLGYSGDNYEVPEGGVVQTVGDTNEPNGILEENACLDKSKQALITPPSFESVLASFRKAQELYASLGVTTAQDASVDTGYHQLLMGASQMNSLLIDIVGLAVQPVTAQLLTNEGTPKREYNNHYKLLGGKTWLDGSPQGKTAWLTQPYYEVPEGQPADYCGYGTQTDEVVTEYFKTCIENNWQANVHCNGDASADQFIRCYRKALELAPKTVDLRPVMVHAQTVREDQLDDMKELGIIPTFFLDHVWFWGDYHYESVFGPERSQKISPAKSALDRGIKFTLHQDPPVKLPNQLLGIHNAVNRQTQSGRVLGEDQKISVIDALRAVTINGAHQYFEEDIKGTIEEGKYADLVILEKSPLEVDVTEIKNIKIVETIKEGNTVFKA
ncbi:MAG: amidohydrolase [Romboutsia sp.]